MNKNIFFLLVFLSTSFTVIAQDDLLSMLDSAEGPVKSQKVTGTFKTTRVINAQSSETVKKGTLDFRITHRFGNAGVASNGGVHTLYGFDNASNIRLSFEYGLTENLMIGIGRSKTREHIDGLMKYRFLTQTIDNKVPLSIAFYSNMAFSPLKDKGEYPKNVHRFSYVFQGIFARKFGTKASVEILPTYVHRNRVIGNKNPDNGASETNDLFSLGGAARIRITKRVSLVGDYFYTFSPYRQNNSANPFYAPLSAGVEIETGGHVFHINMSNSSGIIENDFIPYTNDDWFKGGYKFGFTISRVFVINKSKEIKNP